ncbi:ABC transporter ATP-binding protein [Carboxydothermus ferrireducens]|uniref:Oligopeptide/dipeptide ABC transporter ATP-binding protein n=1 Tax=Carboxydothermus ferrireducens DSM 11255 TaxID=1119529 RepID=A0ABX2R9Q3_9THEO|nr:ABC transporter ATP-binding protein [Carboxydothermus ferrireducens]NYE57906.1 oligopeptide/dipeptide ABC transporter ATP-binding protein [Carboxydothermus ferrireducens DSM 11255]
MAENILVAKNLSKYFNLGHGQVLKAVDRVNLAIRKGETVGLVGESGCGKTTLGRVLAGLYQPTAGTIEYAGQDIARMSKKERYGLHRKIQMIFQDPYASLNPRMTIGEIIAEPIDIHRLATGEERNRRVIELLELVGLNEEHANRFPHELSGGQRQRIGIARALAVKPEFIVLDEPTSALDVSIRAQVINLLEELRKQFGLTYLFISHDLSTVRYLSDRIAVMYLGRIVEITESRRLYENPLHPYTRALLSAVPIADPRIEASRQRIILKGDVPSPINPPEGCRFASRCQYADERCRKETPELLEVEPGHLTACFKPGIK